MKIYNAEIYTMESDLPIKKGYIEIENGIIKAVSQGEPSVIEKGDMDASGMTIYPGFIDAHTHLGIIENGIDFEGDDCNEATDPFTPQMRVIDGINPFDECFKEAVSRGITAVASSPGSANACGGEITVIKTSGRCVDDMLVKMAGIKFALGENPKNVYNGKDETPITRMAITAIIREGLGKAKRYLEDTEAYNADKENLEPPEYDIKNEALMPLLKKDAKAFFHCHRADDICTAIRISKEYNLDCVIIHGTEGHLIPDIIAKAGVPVICGPVICDRCKPEMKGLDIKNAAVMSNEGVKLAICTDHPVIPIQYLPISAQTSCKGGLEYIKALEALTINAAQITGTDDVMGSIAVGKHADLQLYKSGENPLDLMSQPAAVMINGKIVYEESE